MAKLSTAKAIKRIRAAAAHLPGIVDGFHDDAPILDQAGTLKIKGKPICWFKKGLGGALVMRCELEEKTLLMEAAPEIFFETDHYKGWPAILIRLDAISDKELRHRIEIAWRIQAPKHLLNAYESERAQTKVASAPKRIERAAKKARGRASAPARPEPSARS